MPPNAIAVPLLAVLGHTSEIDQARWNAAAQEVLEAQRADDLERAIDAEWERTTAIRECALDAAESVLANSE